VGGAFRNQWTPLTALEVSEHIQAAFDAGHPDVHELLETAVHSRARPVVFAAILRLPRRRFRSVMDVLKELPDLPAGEAPATGLSGK
jgi:hypothetical protein